MDRIAFVTGGSGFVGHRLIERLLAQGWRVRALVRSPSAARAVRELGAEPVDGDLQDLGHARDALRGCSHVFHVAALFKLWGDAADFERINVEGSRALLDAARAAGVARFVQVGAAAVVMGDMEPMVRASETLPRQERRWAPYAASKARAEALVLARNEPGVFETVVLRPPMIWGRGMPMLDHLAENIRAGRFRWVGSGAQAMSTAHVDNVCHAAQLAAERGMGGQAYFVSDGTDSTLRRVLGGLLATRGIPEPRAAVPLPMAWVLATLMEAAWRTLRRPGEPPITRQMLRLIGQPFTVDIAKARRELGYQPLVSWEQGLMEMRA